MKLIKALSGFSIAVTLLFMLSCDDRLPSESETAVETGSLELSYVFVHGSTSNPTIVGEVISASDSKTDIVVIARLLDGEGNGVNGKSLLFESSDVQGDFDTNDPSTKHPIMMKRRSRPLHLLEPS